MKKEINNKLNKVKVFGVSYKLDISYKFVKIPKLSIEEKVIKIILPNKYKKLENNELLKILIEKMYDAIAAKELETIIIKKDWWNKLTRTLNRVNITHNLRERRSCDEKTCHYWSRLKFN